VPLRTMMSALLIGCVAAAAMQGGVSISSPRVSIGTARGIGTQP
jgi:hypothetical protein